MATYRAEKFDPDKALVVRRPFGSYRIGEAFDGSSVKPVRVASLYKAGYLRHPADAQADPLLAVVAAIAEAATGDELVTIEKQGRSFYVVRNGGEFATVDKFKSHEDAVEWAEANGFRVD